MLFSRQPGHGLEPVGVMRSAVFESPILHGSGDDVGIGWIKRGAMGHGPHEAVIHLTREALTHDARVEHVAAIPVGKSLALLRSRKRRNRLGGGNMIKGCFTDGGTHGITPRIG